MLLICTLDSITPIVCFDFVATSPKYYSKVLLKIPLASLVAVIVLVTH